MKKSTGFRSNSSQGFQKTLSKPLAEKISPFDKTWKNEKSMERKQLIQNYFGMILIILRIKCFSGRTFKIQLT